MLDNEAAYDVWTRNLDIEIFICKNLNRLFAIVICSLAISLRFYDACKVDITKFQFIIFIFWFYPSYLCWKSLPQENISFWEYQILFRTHYFDALKWYQTR